MKEKIVKRQLREKKISTGMARALFAEISIDSFEKSAAPYKHAIETMTQKKYN
jgi:hypothetical protein